MPCEQPLRREWFIVVARGVEHHFNDSFDVAVHRFEASDIDAQASRDRGADLLRVEIFPLDFAALEHVVGEGLEHGLLAELEAKTFHAAQQTPCS